MGSQEYLPRIVDKRLAETLQTFPIVVLDGARAIGKTTTAERVANSVIRLPQDLPLLAIDAEATLAAMESPVLIDEWQLAGVDLLWTLKQIVDSAPSPGRFILTGSVEPASYGPTYPLTGRAVRLTMYPMTASELAGVGDQPSLLCRLHAGEALEARIGDAPNFSLDQLFTTGFPAARDQPDPSMFLNGYASLVAQRAGDEGRDSSRLLRTLAVLGVLTAQTVPDQRIWESADVNKATWKAYEDLLERVHLTTALPAFSSNALKRLTTYPKRLLSDTALALALAQLTTDDLARDLNTVGRYLESFVTQQLRPRTDALNGRLSHLRTSGGDHEVDLIIELPNNRYAIGIKAGSRPTPSDAKHLLWLQRELRDNKPLGLIAHTGQDTYPLADDIWALPITRL